MPVDLVNRFVLTPIEGTFNLSGKVISFATNCPDLLSRMADIASECGEDGSAQLDCSWRIVTEPETDDVVNSVALGCRYFRDGLSFVTLGRRSFLAYDDRTRRGISFVSEVLILNSTLFVDTFLPGFLSLLREGKR